MSTSFKGRMLGYGCCQASYVNFLVQVMQDTSGGPTCRTVLWVSICLASLLCALAPRFADNERRLTDLVVNASQLALIIGFALFLSGMAFASPELRIAAIAVVGIGFSLLWLPWGKRLSLYGDADCLLYVVAGIFITAALSFVLSLVGCPPIIASCCYALISCLALRCAYRDGSWIESSSFEPVDADESPEEPEPASREATGLDVARADAAGPQAASRIADASNAACPDAIGAGQQVGTDLQSSTEKRHLEILLYLFASLLPLAYHLGTLSLYPETVTLSGQYLEDLVVGAVLCLFLPFSRKISSTALARVLIVVDIVAVFLTAMLPAPSAQVAAYGANVLCKVLWPLTWVLIIQVSRGPWRRQWKVLATGRASMFAARSVVALSVGASPQFFASLGNDLLPLFAVTLLMVFALLTVPSQPRYDVKPIEVPRAEATLNEACDEVAARFGLTPREAECLRYLARGMSISAAADKLFITPGTMHVHVAHIYTKTGVHSKQEVIDACERVRVELNDERA